MLLLLLVLVGCCLGLEAGCNTVEVAGAAKGQSARMGTFTRVSGVMRFGRPVYQHANKEYLFYWEATKHWLIGPDYTKNSAGVHSQASDALDAYLVPNGTWIENSADGGWLASPAITVGCTSTGTHLAAASTAKHASAHIAHNSSGTSAQTLHE